MAGQVYLLLSIKCYNAVLDSRQRSNVPVNVFAIVTFPCNAVLGKCCWCCEKGCEKAFGACLGCGGEDRPSPLFLTYTIWFTLPIAAVAIWAGFLANEKNCEMFISPIVWAFVLAACCFFFMIFAVRVYITLSRPYDGVDAQARAAEEGREVKDSDRCAAAEHRSTPLLFKAPCILQKNHFLLSNCRIVGNHTSFTGGKLL